MSNASLHRPGGSITGFHPCQVSTCGEFFLSCLDSCIILRRTCHPLLTFVAQRLLLTRPPSNPLRLGSLSRDLARAPRDWPAFHFPPSAPAATSRSGWLRMTSQKCLCTRQSKTENMKNVDTQIRASPPRALDGLADYTVRICTPPVRCLRQTLRRLRRCRKPAEAIDGRTFGRWYCSLTSAGLFSAPQHLGFRIRPWEGKVFSSSFSLGDATAL